MTIHPMQKKKKKMLKIEEWMVIAHALNEELCLRDSSWKKVYFAIRKSPSDLLLQRFCSQGYREEASRVSLQQASAGFHSSSSPTKAAISSGQAQPQDQENQSERREALSRHRKDINVDITV